jgi:hypothetical protein
MQDVERIIGTIKEDPIYSSFIERVIEKLIDFSINNKI